MPRIAAQTNPLNVLLAKGVTFSFTPEHAEVVPNLLHRLASPDVLAFPDFKVAIAEERPFCLVTDPSVGGLDAVIEQAQPDKSVRPFCFVSRSTSPPKNKWTAAELECTAIVWAIKKNRQLFYGTMFVKITDHQPLKYWRACRIMSTVCRGGLTF